MIRGTRYNLVIFEDIDRFDMPHIFVKLREINTLLNNNETLKNNNLHIQFMYALKDSVYKSYERTKFFEFIIPIIPVVGSANSGALFNARFNGLPKQPKQSFIEDVSEFINDARLIHNTINEYLIYQEEITDKNLDPTTLLAVMLYKNIYSDDFEALHSGNGLFARVLVDK